jgi:hypothetical protein
MDRFGHRLDSDFFRLCDRKHFTNSLIGSCESQVAVGFCPAWNLPIANSHQAISAGLLVGAPGNNRKVGAREYANRSVDVSPIPVLSVAARGGYPVGQPFHFPDQHR